MNQSEKSTSGIRTITEPAKELRICDEADVVVVGGGPGGMGAAVAAARSGAKTILIERYGCLGGMATGGLVTAFPNMCNDEGVVLIKGLNEEMMQRLRDRNACNHPPKALWGSKDPKEVAFYRELSIFYTMRGFVNYAVHVDAEELKCIYDDMAEEAGIKIYLHSWGTTAIVDPSSKKVSGVIFESKSGRQAILAKIVIDCTGDGDLLPSVGADFETDTGKGTRVAHASHCFWIANIDSVKYNAWKSSPEGKKEFAAQFNEGFKLGAHPRGAATLLPHQENMHWFWPREECDQIDVASLTRVELNGRKKMRKTLDFLRANTPGYENSYLVLSSPQLGTRGSRRVVGEYMLNKGDADAGKTHEDTVALFPRGGSGGPDLHVPYRALIPRGVDGMLVACRATSMDLAISEFLNLIPHCVAYGQAAGTAAAQAVQAGVGVRDIDIKALQSDLRKQDVVLP